MKIKFLPLFLICFFPNLSNAQGPALNLPAFSTHSPEATGLGQFANYPVDISTGVPSINIPLYTIKGSKLELPLSLSYHASGIKIDQESSVVGLGWILNTGGAVSRILRDLADEGSNGFITSGNSLPDYNSVENLQGAGTIGTNTYLKSAFYGIDKEPDVFSINANGLNADFFLNNTASFLTSEMGQLKLDVRLFENLIIVKDSYGNIYRFGKDSNGNTAVEKTTPEYGVYNREPNSDGTTQSSYNSSWFLTEIISNDGSDTIRFTYKKYYYHDYKIINSTRYKLNQLGLSTLDYFGVNFDNLRLTSLKTDIFGMCILDSICFFDGYVKLEYENDRQDMTNWEGQLSRPRLTLLSVKNMNDERILKISFDNNFYFERVGNGFDIARGEIAVERRKALQLRAVKFWDRNGNFIHQYQFQYDPKPLPPRNTTSQDFWGYYNGMNNESLIPNNFFTYNSLGKPIYLGNRQSDFNFMRAASLTKIIYPGGGYTVYEYEPNYYLTEKQKQNLVKATKNISLFAINRDISCDPKYLDGVPSINSLQFEVNEVIDNNGMDWGKLTVNFTDYKIYNGRPMTAKLKNLNGGAEYKFEHNPSKKDERLIVNQDVLIRQNESYLLELNTNGVIGSNYSMCNSPTIEAYLSYDYFIESDETELVPEQVGGLRIKSISNFDFNDKKISQKIYEYGYEKYGPGKIGIGELITDPSKNFYNYPLLYAFGKWESELVPVVWFSANSEVELGLNKGCPVYYPKVTEISLDNTGKSINGKTEYFYDRPEGDYEPKSSTKYPYVYVNYFPWKKGNLNRKITFVSDFRGQYDTVEVVDHKYEKLKEEKIKTLKIIDFEPDIYSRQRILTQGGVEQDIYFYDNPNRFFYYNYYQSRGKVDLKTESTTSYVDGIRVATTEKNIFYNQRYLPSYFTTKTSKSEEMKSEFKYSFDFFSPPYTEMVNRNMLAPVIELTKINTTKGNKKLSMDRVNYSFWNGSSLIAPSSLQKSFEGRDPQNEVQIDAYDDKGNILQSTSKDGITTAYFWGYNQKRLVATVVGNTYSNSVSTSGISLSKMNRIDLSESDMRNELNKLRLGLPNSLVTTYTYNPIVGLSSATDPKSQTVYYEYDTMGRLILIRDQNRNIIKKICYGYTGQVTDCN